MSDTLHRIAPHVAWRPGEHVTYAIVPDSRHDSSVGRHRRHELTKCRLHVIEVTIDISMIELDRRQDQGVRMVMKEFGRLVEKRRVVLVALDDKMLASPLTEGAIEVERNSANQQGRVSAGRQQDLCEEIGGRRLSVGSAHCDAMMLRDREFIECVGERAIGKSGFDRRERFGIIRVHCVSDDHEIGFMVEYVRGREALYDFNAPIG